MLRGRGDRIERNGKLQRQEPDVEGDHRDRGARNQRENDEWLRPAPDERQRLEDRKDTPQNRLPGAADHENRRRQEQRDQADISVLAGNEGIDTIVDGPAETNEAFTFPASV